MWRAFVWRAPPLAARRLTLPPITNKHQGLEPAKGGQDAAHDAAVVSLISGGLSEQRGAQKGASTQEPNPTPPKKAPRRAPARDHVGPGRARGGDGQDVRVALPRPRGPPRRDDDPAVTVFVVSVVL